MEFVSDIGQFLVLAQEAAAEHGAEARRRARRRAAASWSRPASA